MTARRRDPFSIWLDNVPPSSPRPSGDEGGEAYERWLSLLPGVAARRLDGGATVEEAEAGGPDAVEPRYGLCESEDGQLPVLRMFSTPEALARRLAELEGRDVVAWAFFGRPLAFTRGPIRHVELPDGSAIKVPFPPGAVPERVEALPAGAEVQDDGFLGPPELSLGTAGYWEGPEPPGVAADDAEDGWGETDPED